MHIPEKTDTSVDITDRWRECTVREKTEVIANFLNECGEHATWQEWRAFLHKHNTEGFEWMHTVLELTAVEDGSNELP